MTNTILHKSATRGDANHGWLHSRHTDKISATADSQDAEVLLMDVPMNL